MKGQTKELMEILILVIGASVLILISYFMFTSTVPKTRSLLLEMHEYERVTDVIKNFYYTKIPIIDKTHAQLLGDMVVNEYDDIVDYGDKYGGINATKMIYEYFDAYFYGKWHLRVLGKKRYNFGYDVPINVRKRTFSMEFPLPSYSGEVVNLEFKQW